MLKGYLVFRRRKQSGSKFLLEKQGSASPKKGFGCQPDNRPTRYHMRRHTDHLLLCLVCNKYSKKKNSPSPILIFLFSLLTSIDPPLPSRGLSIYSSPPKVAAAATGTGNLGMFQITRFVKIIYKLKQLGSQ